MIGRLALDWRWIGNGLAGWQRIGRLAMDCRIDSGLGVDRHMIGRLTEDWHRIDMGLADWQWLGGLVDWQLIGESTVDW